MALKQYGRSAGRPAGSTDKRPRAVRGSKMAGGIVGFSGKIGSERINATFGTKFSEFTDDFALEFYNVIEKWSKNIFTPRLHSSIKNSLWVRSGKLLKVDTRVSKPPTGGASQKITFTVSANFPDAETEKVGLSQEFGRPSGGAKKAKYYMVPLATWINETGRAAAGSAKGGRKWKTSDDIKKDLSQPGVFWGKNTVDTSAGPARMVYLYNKGYFKEKKTGSYRDPVTGRFIKRKKNPKFRDALGRKLTRGKLKEIATAMYLAYSTVTGIFGTSKTYAKSARLTKSPLAAQFGLTVSSKSNAPMWFSRGAISSLAKLANAIDSVRVKSEALGRAKYGAGGDSETPTQHGIAMENAKDETIQAIFDQIQFENEEGREPSELEKRLGLR
jgi:hypothetical protein